MSVKIPAGFSLLEGERPVWRGRISWKAQWWLLLLGVLTIWLFGLGIIFFIIATIRVYSSEYFVTNKRVYVKYGLIAREIFDLKNEWITNYIVKQGVIGRILSFGDIVISTPGHYAGTAVMRGVSDPTHIKTLLEETLRRAEKAKEVEKKLRRLEEEHDFGRISDEKYRELKAKYEEELRKY